MTQYLITDPATGETSDPYPEASDGDVDAALATATTTFASWRETPVDDRAAALHRVAELHRERRADLAARIVREMGKVHAAALEEVDFAADIIDYYADHAEEITKDRPIDLAGDGSAVVRPAPLGPLLGIMPWNFPYYQVARFAAPNLLLGNTVLLKHAPQCPSSAEAIAEMYRDAGFPEGAYTNLYASNEQIADVIADPRLQGVSLTGSERAGAAVAEIAGRNLKKCVLELGGSDPFIVLSTDDLDATVQAAVDARLDNSGQSCNGAKRFVVVDELFDAFRDAFVEKMRAVRPLAPSADDAVLGPLSSETAAARLAGQIDRATDQGATLLLGGTRDGAFFEPTVLTDVTPAMDVWNEELFGPAAVLYRAADEAAAVEIANGTGFGLGSYLFTTDPDQAERVANRIEAGMVYVNMVLADSPELPFGGIKRSGTGRELGLLGADEFVNKKLIRTP
jgi:succinate-semialdehyde dehydrogenase/glutarate-semialdehyde dehydrogenase